MSFPKETPKEFVPLGNQTKDLFLVRLLLYWIYIQVFDKIKEKSTLSVTLPDTQHLALICQYLELSWREQLANTMPAKWLTHHYRDL